MTVHIAFNPFLTTGACLLAASFVLLVAGMLTWGKSVSGFLLQLGSVLLVAGPVLIIFGLGRGAH
jgi:hypothetical protein